MLPLRGFKGGVGAQTLWILCSQERRPVCFFCPLFPLLFFALLFLFSPQSEGKGHVSDTFFLQCAWNDNKNQSRLICKCVTNIQHHHVHPLARVSDLGIMGTVRPEESRNPAQWAKQRPRWETSNYQGNNTSDSNPSQCPPYLSCLFFVSLNSSSSSRLRSLIPPLTLTTPTFTRFSILIAIREVCQGWPCRARK